MKKVLVVVMAIALGVVHQVRAAEEDVPAKSLAELLELVRDGKVVNAQTNARRFPVECRWQSIVVTNTPHRRISN